MGYPSKIGHYRDGFYRRNVIDVSTQVSTFTPLVSQSGAVFFVDTWTTGTIQLPRISSKWLGLEYEFFLAAQASSNDVKINAAGDSSAAIFMNLSSVVASNSTVIPGSTFPTGLRVTAVSSIVWVGQPITANSYSMSSAATDNLAGWTTG